MIVFVKMKRCFPAHSPRQVLVRNGQQTLGVALPWAIAANLARPNCPVISVSSDGGFMFSSTELESAVRLGARFVHLLWDSGSLRDGGVSGSGPLRPRCGSQTWPCGHRKVYRSLRSRWRQYHRCLKDRAGFAGRPCITHSIPVD